jgi:hypothetical protein
VRQITEYHRIRRHDAAVDAALLTALDVNLIACREVAKALRVSVWHWRVHHAR